MNHSTARGWTYKLRTASDSPPKNATFVFSYFSFPGVEIRIQRVEISRFGSASHFSTQKRNFLYFCLMQNDILSYFSFPGVEIRTQRVQISRCDNDGLAQDKCQKSMCPSHDKAALKENARLNECATCDGFVRRATALWATDACM